jgi:pyrroloquinoline quinone (PQQ) biosynthesis protein C
MKNVAEVTQAVFLDAMKRFGESRAILALRGGQFTVRHYKCVLKEIYHYAKEDPQIQALASVYFRGEDRAAVKMFLKHATAEIGHELMALKDLKALGEDVSEIPYSNPLPSTIALTAFPFYQIHYQNPIGYLGYLYFLEHMPTKSGPGYMEALKKAGVPDNALGFLQEHTTVDVGHNRLMQEYLMRLVRSDSDLQSVSYAIQVTAQLYADMLWGAMESAEKPVDYGFNSVELARAVSIGRQTDLYPVGEGGFAHAHYSFSSA